MVQMLQIQQDYQQCIAYGEKLNQRVNVMEAEAAVLRSALADSETSRAVDAEQFAAESAAASPRPELRSTAIQAGLPAGLMEHSSGRCHGDRSGSCSEILCMSAYTQTDAQQPVRCEAAGTQTDDESLKDERLKMWEESKKHRPESANRTGTAALSCELGGGNEGYFTAASHGSARRATAHRPKSSVSQRFVNSEASINLRDVFEDGQWVHGRNGCAAFVGDAGAPGDAADVASIYEQHSPPAPPQGQQNTQPDRHATIGGTCASASRAEKRQEQHAAQASTYSACSSVDVERQIGSFSSELRQGAHEEHVQYGQEDMEFHVVSSVHQQRSAGSNSRRRSVSVPPTPRADPTQRAGDVRGMHSEHLAGVCNAAHGGEGRPVEVPGGRSGLKRRDLSIPARIYHREFRHHSVGAPQHGKSDVQGVHMLAAVACSVVMEAGTDGTWCHTTARIFLLSLGLRMFCFPRGLLPCFEVSGLAQRCRLVSVLQRQSMPTAHTYCRAEHVLSPRLRLLS